MWGFKFTFLLVMTAFSFSLVPSIAAQSSVDTVCRQVVVGFNQPLPDQQILSFQACQALQSRQCPTGSSCFQQCPGGFSQTSQNFCSNGQSTGVCCQPSTLAGEVCTTPSETERCVDGILYRCASVGQPFLATQSSCATSSSQPNEPRVNCCVDGQTIPDLSISICTDVGRIGTCQVVEQLDRDRDSDSDSDITKVPGVLCYTAANRCSGEFIADGAGLCTGQEVEIYEDDSLSEIRESLLGQEAQNRCRSLAGLDETTASGTGNQNAEESNILDSSPYRVVDCCRYVQTGGITLPVDSQVPQSQCVNNPSAFLGKCQATSCADYGTFVRACQDDPRCIFDRGSCRDARTSERPNEFFFQPDRPENTGPIFIESVADSFLNVPIFGLQRISESIQIGQLENTGSEYVSGVGLGVLHYLGITDLVPESNRLFYQIGIPDDQLQDYLDNPLLRLEDATRLSLGALSTAATVAPVIQQGVQVSANLYNTAGRTLAVRGAQVSSLTASTADEALRSLNVSLNNALGQSAAGRQVLQNVSSVSNTVSSVASSAPVSQTGSLLKALEQAQNIARYGSVQFAQPTARNLFTSAVTGGATLEATQRLEPVAEAVETVTRALGLLQPTSVVDQNTIQTIESINDIVGCASDPFKCGAESLYREGEQTVSDIQRQLGL